MVWYYGELNRSLKCFLQDTALISRCGRHLHELSLCSRSLAAHIQKPAVDEVISLLSLCPNVRHLRLTVTLTAELVRCIRNSMGPSLQSVQIWLELEKVSLHLHVWIASSRTSALQDPPLQRIADEMNALFSEATHLAYLEIHASGPEFAQLAQLLRLPVQRLVYLYFEDRKNEWVPHLLRSENTALVSGKEGLRAMTIIGGSSTPFLTLLARLPNLTFLEVMLDSATEQAFVDALHHLSHLRALELWGDCGGSAAIPDKLPELCPRLEHLRVWCDISDEAVLRAAGKLDGLKSLRIGVNANNDVERSLLLEVIDRGQLEYIFFTDQIPAEVVCRLLEKCQVGQSIT